MTYSIPLRDPPVTVQEPHQCWSAAYESWSTACSWIIPGATPVSEASIEACLAQYPNALDAHGGATSGGIGLLQNVGNVQFEGVAGADLSSALLQSHLTRFGYIFLPFWAHGRHGIFSHAVVISHASNGRMRVMDPGEGRGLSTVNTSYYRNAIVMLIGTHQQAH